MKVWQKRQKRLMKKLKGPSAKIAKDAQGNWSKAIQGFSRGQGATPDDLILKGDYYYAKKHIDGVKSRRNSV